MIYYTDGSVEWSMVNHCPYCTLNTGGEHETDCPCRGLLKEVEIDENE